MEPLAQPLVVLLALFGLVALAAAVAAGIAWQRARLAATAAAERLAGREEEIRQLREVRELRDETLETLRREHADLAARLAAAEAQLAAEREASAEKLALLAEAREQLGERFQSLAGAALERNSSAFMELARRELERLQEGAKSDLESRGKAIGELVAPLAETLGRVDTKLGEVEKGRSELQGQLASRLESLASSQLLLQSETARLARALRAPAVRGRWGEVQLKRVVELAGMVEHCDFTLQEHLSADIGSADGARRPDLVVHLPAGRTLAVDAKAPLEHYLASLEADADEERDRRLDEHARGLRRHVGELAGRGYWERLPGSPEFVVLFLPGETFFGAALERDPALLEHGVERRVILATPSTLIALLKAVAHGWREERLAEGAREVRRLGSELHDRLRVFLDHLASLGRGLDQSIKAYNRAVGSLESRVLPSARRFRELGAAGGGELPRLEPLDRSARELAPGEDEREDEREHEPAEPFGGGS